MAAVRLAGYREAADVTFLRALWDWLRALRCPEADLECPECFRRRQVDASWDRLLEGIDLGDETEVARSDWLD